LRYQGRWICARVSGEALAVGCEAEVRAVLEREGHRVVVAEDARAGDLPFDEGSFDTVLLGDFLAGWAGRERPLAEARRVLRPRGRLIVSVPYGGGEGDDRGVSLAALLDGLGEFSVKEIATAEGRICLLAERAREKSRATVWRRALGVAEERLAERMEAVRDLAASAAGLEASREREERALADARGDVARLETALAAATHERDLQREQARLAGDGVEQLERRLERLRRDRDLQRVDSKRDLEAARGDAERTRETNARLEKDLLEARSSLEAGLSEARVALEAKQEALAEAEGAVQATERELAALRARLEAREEELERSRTDVGDARAELASVRERLEGSERELAVHERDLAARVRELGQAGGELVARERELEEARAELRAREQRLDEAGALLEARGVELSRALERIGEAERERDEARARLETRERHLKTAQLGVESRDRKLEVAGEKLQAAEQRLQAAGQRQGETERSLRSREAELERQRAATRDRERKLAQAEARLEKAQLRVEGYRSSLLELRAGRSYKLMRILWRLRRPFRRTPREATPAEVGVGEDAEPGPPAGLESSLPAPKVELAERSPPPPPRGDRLRVAAILDEMSAACFAPECELVPLRLEGWHEQLDERRPDLLLVESAWNGNGGEWQYRVAQYPRKDLVGLPALRALLDGCRERGIPTAFWNKEDPVHFDRFAEAASLFGHVFTTDAGCVERYRALPGERTATPLPFAAQPRIHNPTAAVPERSSAPCFAGAWYRDRHSDRRRALEALLDAARPYGLVIYDRRYGAEDDAFGFPERFAPHVLGKLPYERILDVYKSHHVFLNANSVVDSPTMCSRRVFELAAGDTAILSTPGAALSALLGEGTVDEVADEEAASAALERLLGDAPERARRTRAARRRVFAEHTYADRLATIATTLGLDPGRGDQDEWELVLQPGVGLSEDARADLRAAATFAGADVIGAAPANGTPAPEHRLVSDLDPRALLLRRELIEARGRPDGGPERLRARLREWSDDGVRLYAADADLLTTG
jgi:hypothetical protein